MKPPIRDDEINRLAALDDHEILDTLPEEVYTRIAAVASQLCETPIALFTLVAAERQWFKARIGLEVEEASRDLSFCAHAIAGDGELLVDDTLRDPRFVENALVINAPNIRFYFGVPVHGRNGLPLGTHCVIDRVPRQLTSNQRAVLGELAREIEVHLELRIQKRELTELLDQRAVMSSMIAHDARNLMTRVVGELYLLNERVKGDESDTVARAQTAVRQLLRMCENFVALNKGSVQPTLVSRPAPADLAGWVNLLVRREDRSASMESVELDARIQLDRPSYRTDVYLLERLVLNLLDNAYRQAPSGSLVLFELKSLAAGGFSLTVENRGAGVPESLREHIFEPFFSVHPGGGRSTGLGLAFCRLAAGALGGSIVHETPAAGGVRFRVEILEG